MSRQCADGGGFFLVWESILVLEVLERSCDGIYCTLMLTVLFPTSTHIISPDGSFMSTFLLKIQNVYIRGSDMY